MKVFISWSGPVSHRVAVALRDWLPSVLQAIEPYVSSEDIDKGARWNTDISKELEDASFGILCITPENLEAPWLNFEAGALSKSLDRARVAPFLFQVERTAITGPLLQFQSTLVEAEDVRKLIRSLNVALGDHALEETRLDEIFDVWWPRLEETMGSIAASPPQAPTKSRSESDLLTEVVELVRSQQQLLTQPENLLPPKYLRSVLSDRPTNGTIHPRAIEDLEEGWRKLVRDVDERDGGEELTKDVRRLQGPVEYILRQYEPSERR